MKKSAPSRIIFVSSASAFITNLTVDNINYPQNHPMTLYRTTLIYGNSKLCNVIAANGFAEKLKNSGVTANSLHPGLVNTDIYLKSGSFLGMKSFAQLFKNVLLFAYGKVRILLKNLLYLFTFLIVERGRGCPNNNTFGIV